MNVCSYSSNLISFGDAITNHRYIKNLILLGFIQLRISLQLIRSYLFLKMKKFCVILLAFFVASAVSQSLDEKRRAGGLPTRGIDPIADITTEEKEAIHEAVKILSLNTSIDPKERTQILKQLMSGEIDFKEALEKARKLGGEDLTIDSKYAAKIDEIGAKLKHRRSMHMEELQKSREEMRNKRKARMDARNEM